MPEGLIFCECGVGLPPDEDMINKIQALIAPYSNKSFEMKKSRRSTMARRPLESSRCHKGCAEAHLFLDPQQMVG